MRFLLKPPSFSSCFSSKLAISQFVAGMSATLRSRDMFSNLPLEVTHGILQLLPLEDAARTSILSKCWRYKWLSLPNLILDFNQFYIPLCSRRNQFFFWRDEFPVMEYSNIISNILLRHIGPISKFSLYIPGGFSDGREINHWLEFVSRQGVKEFTLHHIIENQRKVPSCVFTCVGFSRLTHLTLIKCCILSFPSAFKGFSCLISLTVHQWNDNSNLSKLEMLIFCCPHLEQLVIEGVSKDDTLTIHAPKLHKFVIHGKISDICLKGSPNIQSLSLYVFNSSKSNMLKFFSCTPGIEKLFLKGWHSISDGWFKHGATWENPGIEFRLLRTLVLTEVPIDSQLTVSLIVRLLKGSPLLQRFEIHGSSQLQKLIGEDEKWEDISLEDCSLGYLKNVLVVCARGFNGVLQLSKVLIASSPVLEIMIVDVTKLYHKEQKLNMAKELLRHPRPSTRAQILFET